MQDFIREIELHSYEIKSKKTGNTFVKSSGELNGKWYQIKFTKQCQTIPKEKGIYLLKFDLGNSSVQKGKTVTNSDGEIFQENDIIWVHEVVELRKYSKEEMLELNRKKVSESLGF